MPRPAQGEERPPHELPKMARAWQWAISIALLAVLLSGIRGPALEIAVFLIFASLLVWLLRYGEREVIASQRHRNKLLGKTFLRYLVPLDEETALEHVRGTIAILALALAVWLVYAILRLLGIAH